jgi:hypothetical protein
MALQGVLSKLYGRPVAKEDNWLLQVKGQLKVMR